MGRKLIITMLRDELLNSKALGILAEAKVLDEGWYIDRGRGNSVPRLIRTRQKEL